MIDGGWSSLDDRRGRRLVASLRLYDRFYADLFAVMARAGAGGRPFVVLDLHSYNHGRGGPGAPPADTAGNPEINVGTGSLDRDRFGGLADRFKADLQTVEVAGRPLDVAIWGGVQEALGATVPGMLDELERLRAVRPLRRRGSDVA